MAIGIKDDFLISHLLEKTYQSLPTPNSDYSNESLDQHFDKLSSESSSLFDPTLENFIARQANEVVKLEYIAQIGCYRFKSASCELDLPGNWDCFKQLTREIAFVDLSQSELAPLIETIIGHKARVLLIGIFGQAQFAVFDQHDEFSLKWIEKYFSTVEKKEAA